MFVDRNEYEKLRDRAKLANKLEEECQRLAELISAENKDCRVGGWCKNCKYLGEDLSLITEPWIGCGYIKELGGKVQYCMKHLREICPEFEDKEKE